MISNLFAYVGLGPGPEFLPYFLALLSLLAAATVAVLQWPVVVVLRCLAKVRRPLPQPPSDQPLSHDALAGLESRSRQNGERSDDGPSDR